MLFAMRAASLALVALVATGCERTKTENSEGLTEPATLIDLVYMPSRHGSGVGPTFGMTSGGDASIGIAITSVDIPERYAVVFRCQHGKFIIQSAKAKELWQRLKLNQEVTVSYKEVYRTVYDDKKVVSRVLVKYDFLDAR